MSAPQVVIGVPSTDGTEDDVDMASSGAHGEIDGANGLEQELDGMSQIEPDVAEIPKFVDYLRSPIVEIAVGEGEESEILYAHQALLVQSPLFADLLADAETTGTPRRLAVNEDLPALASALEYLYRKDYFPQLTAASALEADPSIPAPDTAGVALLRHARIYTLARKLGLPALSALAHRKIHLVESTARGEIAYAQYVYQYTTEEDKDIRRPVAQFWAMRSHVLRHEAEADFRETCLKYPQFGFDVLTMVLDAQEKRSGRLDAASGAPSRKRSRLSQA